MTSCNWADYDLHSFLQIEMNHEYMEITDPYNPCINDTLLTKFFINKKERPTKLRLTVMKTRSNDIEHSYLTVTNMENHSVATLGYQDCFLTKKEIITDFFQLCCNKTGIPLYIHIPQAELKELRSYFSHTLFVNNINSPVVSNRPE